MKKKFALFAFNGESMCFIHVLLNALDLDAKGYDVKLVIEGSATKMLPKINKADHVYNKLFKTIIEKGLIDSVCSACAKKLKVYDEIQELNLNFSDEMKGHPSFSSYIDQGYEIISM